MPVMNHFVSPFFRSDRSVGIQVFFSRMLEFGSAFTIIALRSVESSSATIPTAPVEKEAAKAPELPGAVPAPVLSTS